MKDVLSDITSYFVSSYKGKLNEKLENSEYDKNEIKDEKDNNIKENPFKPIHKTKTDSVDKTRFQGLSSDEYFKNKNNNEINNDYYNNYRSSAFNAIINENMKEDENNIHRKSEKIIPQPGINQINQLNDANSFKSSKGFSNKIKGIFSGNFKPFFKSEKNK